VVYRELTLDEIAQVPGVPSPLPGIFFMVGAVDDDGKVAAACGIYAAIHLDPMWVRDDRRKSPMILRRLWNEMKEFFENKGISNVTVGMLDENPGPPNESVIAKMCEFAGGHEVRGRIFVIDVGRRRKEA